MNATKSDHSILAVTMTRELKLRLRQRALAEGITASEYVRRIITRELESAIVLTGGDDV